LVQVDKKLVTKVAQESDPEKLEKLMKSSMIVNSQSKSSHMFMDTPMDDSTAGFLLLAISLVLLSTCLILLVTTLQSVFRGRAALWMKSLLNLEFKSVPGVADYVLILFGAGITILMQSSSITTSTLTPLVGIGLIKLEKMFPFTVGANIGTTVTGILSALAGSNIATGMTVALSHLLFNLLGTLIWFPLPFMRRVPVNMAKMNGNLAAEWKAFPIIYLVIVFGLLPLTFFLLSLAGIAVVATLGVILILAMIAAAAILTLRLKRPSMLPEALTVDPAWMPNSLKLNPDEDAAEEGTGHTASADLGAGSWWQGTWAWGMGWFLVMFLIFAVPNCQWGILKYSVEDGRDHTGIGAWVSCSKSFEKEVTFIAEPVSGSASDLAECSEAFVDTCSDAGFEEESEEDALEVYIAAWQECRSTCSPKQWLDHCKAQPCADSSHSDNCQSVFEGSTKVNYPFRYGTVGEVAWNEGAACRPNGDICSNAAALAHAGNLGVVGLVFAFAAQGLMLSYVFLDGKRDMTKFLQGSAAGFAACWVFLLASWAVFASALDADAECKVMDLSGTGAVIATGKFGDIVEASFSYNYVMYGWLLTTAILAVITHRIATTRSKADEPSEKLSEQVNA